MAMMRKLMLGVITLFGSTCGLVAAAQINSPTPSVAVGPQYDTTHVYVPPSKVDAFVKCFLATFGGKSTPQVVVTVTPTPSKTTSQLLQTPVGTVSLFGFTTPVPVPFGTERNGYLVTDMTAAISRAREAGADVIVTPFNDPIGVDAVVQWPGGVNTQLYWHTKAPSYAPFLHAPESRVYLSSDRADSFIRSFLQFSSGRVVTDEASVPGSEIGRSNANVRRVRIESTFGKLTVYVTDGHLPWPYGEETTGYELDDLNATLERATGSGAVVLFAAKQYGDRRSAMLSFPGGYIAELHQPVRAR